MKHSSETSTSTVKICLIFTHGVSLQTWANTGMLAREIKPYVELAKSGAVEISFLTYGGHTDLEFQAELHPIEILPAFTGDCAPHSNVALALGGFYALLQHRKALSQTKVFKSNQMLGSHIAWLGAKLFGGKFLLRTGYEFYDFTRKRSIGGLKTLLAWLISFISYRTADLIVVATKGDSEVAKTVFGANPNQIAIQPNWIDTDRFAPLATVKKGKRDFLTVVRLDPQKNLPAVIRAVKQAQSSIDILGAGPLRNELVELAHSINADVNFLDNVPNDKLPPLMQTYRGFVLCSHYEGNPKALLEAMSCAMPVVGTDVPGIANLISNGVDGLLCAEDASAISVAMTKLLDDELNAKHMGKNARNKAITENSLANFLIAERDRYRTLLVKN